MKPYVIRDIEYYANEIPIPILGLIGIIGNILCVFVFCQSKMIKHGTSILLISLAFADILFLFCETLRFSLNFFQVGYYTTYTLILVEFTGMGKFLRLFTVWI